MTKIQLIREELGMSRAQLAKKVDSTVANIKGIEENREEMLISESIDIARVLGVRPNTIRVLNPSQGCFPREKKA